MTHDIYYATTQRRWIRLKLKLTVGSESSYRESIAQHKPMAASFMGWYELPKEVESLVHKHAMVNNDLSDDMEIDIELGAPVSASNLNCSPRVTTVLMDLDADHRCQLQHLTDLLRYQDIPTYLDDELVTASVEATWFVANVKGHWHWYRPVLAGSWGLDVSWRRLQTMIALRKVPFTSQLVGVVLDSKSRLLKGILGELPTNGPLFAVIANHRRERQPVTWERKIKWAEQIIGGLAAFHAHNSTICGLRTYSAAVCVDSDDDVVVQGLSHASHPSVHQNSGLTPPEYRNETYELSDGHVDTKFDIFQLGLLLWHLMREENQFGAQNFCLLADCSSSSTVPCLAAHVDPITLPQSVEGTPQYLEDIIRLCRQERPEKRPPAWKLLRMFPGTDEIFGGTQEQDSSTRTSTSRSHSARGKRSFTRLEDVRRIYLGQGLCDICGNGLNRYRYHCITCNQGNFDVCSRCFEGGKHCLDATHLLVKQDAEDWLSRERNQKYMYYSSPKGSKGRRVIRD
ncbi:hypothetical protein BKA63DRAFT_83365 [Paraphoma chrysanthemicola]|nr:hypothetical protein BKA63DRAFT_83365 [Paraphoma chrysanthemicola]